MTYNEIKSEIESLVAFMQEREFAECSGDMYIKAHENPTVCLRHRLSTNLSYQYQYIWGRGDSPESALKSAREKVAEEKSPHDLNVSAALSLLAKAMEAAKIAGIEDELINPLQIIADRLAKNALEVVRAEK